MTGPVVHPLLQEAVVGEIERAASEHRGSRWVCGAFTDLDDLACIHAAFSTGNYGGSSATLP